MVLWFWLQCLNTNVNSFGGRGAIGIVSSKQLVALEACLNVTEAWTQVWCPQGGFFGVRRRRCHGAARGLIGVEAQLINGICIPPDMCLKIDEGARTFMLVDVASVDSR